MRSASSDDRPTADARPDELRPDDMPARLLHRDGLMLVIDKPAGLPVHPGPKGGPTLLPLLEGLRFGLPRPPVLAHRLDRDTSGCLVLGRHPKATARLGKLFAAGRVEKAYLAVLAGMPPTVEGVIEAPLARRDPDPRSWWMKVDSAGLPSVTRWRVLRAAGGVSVVLFRPETGRTHQLRVHAAHLGCPIVGDTIYGGEAALAVDRNLHLHAWRVAVPLQAGKPPVRAEAPVPPHMRALVGDVSGA